MNDKCTNSLDCGKLQMHLSLVQSERSVENIGETKNENILNEAEQHN